MGDSLPGLLIDLVNDSIKGEIRPRKVTYKAPATAILDDIVVVDPKGKPVANVEHIEATASLTAILAGRIEIDTLTVRAPRLLLELKNGTLNLAEAFSPKKPSSGEAPNLTVSIEKFRFTGGGLRFRDDGNVTIAANNASASGSVRIKLAEGKVRVEVNALQIPSGELKLPDLDLPFSDGQVTQVVYRNNRIDLTGVTGTVLGRAFASVSGNIGLRQKEGRLELDGRVNGREGIWPPRLEPPPFPLPAFNTAFSVRGPFANPVITVDGRSQGFRAFDYGIESVRFRTRITKALVNLMRTDVRLVGGGRLKATGNITLPKLDLDVGVDVVDVPLSVAAAPAKLKPTPRGLANGRIFVTGKANGDVPIGVGVNLAVTGARAFDLNLPSRLDASATLSITPTRIDVRRSKVQSPSKSLVATATGAVLLKRETLNLAIEASATRPLKIVDGVPPELVVARGSFDGRVEGSFQNPKVIGALLANDVDAFGVTSDRLSAQLRVDKRRVLVDNARGQVLDGQLTASATVNLQARDLPLSASVKLVDADLSKVKHEAVKDLGLKGRASVNASVEGVAKNPVVRANVNAEGVIVQNERIGHVDTRLDITKDRIIARDLTVDGAVARVRSRSVQIGLSDQSLGGRLSIERVDLEAIDATTDLQLKGGVDGVVDLAGHATAPRVFARLNVSRLALQEAGLGDGPIDICVRPVKEEGPPSGETARDRCLRLSDATADTKKKTKAPTELVPLVVEASGNIRGDKGQASVRGAYDVNLKAVHAQARVRDVEVGPLLKTFVPSIGPLEGVASASVRVFGPVDALDGNIDLFIPDVATAPGKSLVDDDPTTLVDNLRAHQSRGAVRVTAAIRDGKLDAKVCGFPARENRMRGALCPDGSQIQVRAEGPIRQRDGAFDLRLTYDVQEKELEELIAALRENDLAASAHIDGKARIWRKGAKGQPLFRLDDLPEAVAESEKTQSEQQRAGKTMRVDANTSTSTKPPKSTSDTATKKAESEATEKKTPEDARPIGFDVDARVISQSLEAPGAPRATLARVARVHVDSAGTVTLRTPLRYEIGDSEVVVKGGLTPERVDATVDGTLALALLKLFPDVISNASGTAVAKLSFEGPYRPLPRIRGELIPSPGAVISPRGLGQQVQFAGGKLVFSGREENPLEQRLTAEDLAVTVDDGAASLDGDVLVQLPASATDRLVVSQWDLRASGVGIRIKRNSTFVESAFDLTMKGPQTKPVLAGNVEITDGFIREQFELKNFVLTSAPDAPPTPLVDILRPASLENLEFNVNIGVRNFRARADIATFGLDAILVGDVRLTQSARLYAISGAIEVAQGDIRFPYAQFEIEQTRIEFPPASAGLAPKVYLDARADLPSPKNGLDTDLPCELTLDGDFEKLKLELSAPEAPRSVSDTDLLKFVLFGVPLTAGDLSADPDAALRAVSSELTSDVSRELEQAIQNNFGAALQVNLFAESTQAGAGIRYEVGSRLDVEGETGVAYGNGTNNLGGLAGQVRVRLLLFDHLPGLLGEEAAVEGQIRTSGAVASDATRGELRLTWRVFEE